MNWRELIAALEREGVEELELLPALLGEPEEEELPWFVRGLIIGGAWLAGACLVGFAAMLFLDTAEEAMATGAILCAVAVVLRRQISGDFGEQLCFAWSVAGQMMLVGGFGVTAADVLSTALLALAIEVALLFTYPDRNHRFLNTKFAVFAVVGILYDLEIAWGLAATSLACAVGSGLLWSRAPALRSPLWAQMRGPIAYGLATSLYLLLLDSLERSLPLWGPWWPATMGMSLALAGFAVWIARERGAGWLDVTVIALGILALGALTLQAPGVIAGVGGLVVGAYARSRVLQGIALLSLIGFGSGYYYNLEISLLAKSGALAGSGTLVLALRAWMLRRSTPFSESGNQTTSMLETPEAPL